MKTNILNILAAAALIGGATSCSETWSPKVEEEGSVEFASFAIDATDADKIQTEVNSTVGRASIDLSGFMVTVVDLKGEAADRNYTYGDMPEVLTLPVGSYRLDVKSHEVQKAEWERPLYAGSKEFTIENAKITNIGVVKCAFASLKVSVIFSKELQAVCPDAKMTVLANDEGTLVFTPSETRSGYFEVVPGSTTLIAKFEGTIGGSYTEEYTPFTDIAAGQHHIITYKTKNTPGIPDETGKVDPSTGITIDTSIVKEDIDGNVTVEEDPIQGELPWGPEDPVGGEDPTPPTPPVGDDKAAKFEPSEESVNLKLAPAENVARADFGPAVVNISCPKGFAHLQVNISTDNEGFESAVGAMLPLSFDLAYLDDELAAQLGPNTGLGFPVNEQVRGATEAKFDITMFVGLLANFAGKHTFTIQVTDMENQAETTSLIFTATGE
ncbi:MAG: DUF4493 domain-containing protein [Muribaculaceae bacterium]|nr:DUF4493 domain-containing protein [Muribaculaceae bacterium]